jgi:hypothetical protein
MPQAADEQPCQRAGSGLGRLNVTFEVAASAKSGSWFGWPRCWPRCRPSSVTIRGSGPPGYGGDAGWRPPAAGAGKPVRAAASGAQGCALGSSVGEARRAGWCRERPIPLPHLTFKRPGSTGAGCVGWLGGPASSRDAALIARFVELRYCHRGAQYCDSGPRFRLRPLCCHRRTRLLTTASSPGGPALVGRMRCWKGASWQSLARASQQ